ncbi:MAG: transposase [Fusobacteriaceae bacterium]|jgi:transposase-like protein|nr:transposase [Fusobacteriaceae bacterium]MDD5624239.1 transposase [Candidatus Cloacimonadota bacterium]OQC16411.1 MAG: Transposase, Mutator family [Firmicutes bacterium ADurb.Bin080]
MVGCYLYKVRSERAKVAPAVLIATTLKEDGRRDVLGFQLGNKESSYNLKAFYRVLKNED